jgi:hypothetical protein
MPNYHARPRADNITPPSAYGYSRTGYAQSGRKPFYGEQTSYVAPAAPIMYAPQMNYSNMPTAPPPGLRPSFGPIAAPAPSQSIDRSAQLAAESVVRQRQRETEERERQRRNQPAGGKDKVVGGVAQELDYEMDQMTDYVSEMAQEIVMPRSKVSPAFRKFVSGLLSSTRLPSSTILLGLNYLAKRMTMLNTPTPYKSTDGQVWRMLTIALLLGSKFLDDNTFQNRSWSEVSGIPVSELNSLESEWLVAIDFRLHVDAVTDNDYQLWLASWASWKDLKNKQRTATLDRLAPLALIDTNVQRQNSQRKTYSPQSAYPSYSQSAVESRQQPAYQAPSRQYEQSWSQQAEMSPPSAPESGPNTPEYMMLPGSGLPPTEWYGYNSFYTRRNQPASSTNMPYVPAQTAPYHTPFHNNYSHSIWTGQHPIGCGCSYCSRANDNYFMPPSYNQQTVVG